MSLLPMYVCFFGWELEGTVADTRNTTSTQNGDQIISWMLPTMHEFKKTKALPACSLHNEEEGGHG